MSATRPAAAPESRPALLRRSLLAVAAGGLLALSPALLMAWQGGAGGSSGAAPAPGAAAPGDPAAMAIAERTGRVWSVAKEGDWEALGRSFIDLPPSAALASLRASVDTLRTNLAEREQLRKRQIERVTRELDRHLSQEPTPLTLSEALKDAIELQTLLPQSQRPALLKSERFVRLIGDAAKVAAACEQKMDWLMANELYSRLNILTDVDATFKADARRLGDRLGMIRLYAPEKFWEMRNARRLMDKLSPLPPFNPVGEGFREKLEGISKQILRTAISRAARAHVERKEPGSLRPLLLGGLEAVKTMAGTPDLQQAFPGLKDPAARQAMLAAIDEQMAAIAGAAREPAEAELDAAMEALLAANARTTRIDDNAVLHEFGNGAFSRLDEFSAIIWPDELARFLRLTQGSFVGVGIQIQLDDETQMVRVVTPIEGTPAQRAGIRAGDRIKKIDDKSAIGMSLDQVVELITGRRDSRVSITVERDAEEVTFNLTRARIPIHSVKGWARTGAGEKDWNYFIDAENKLGYVRLTQFTDSTTADLNEAIDTLKAGGVRGMILDLRFNPGGLLTQAVSVANTFVEKGTIVYTESAGGSREQTEEAVPSGLRVRNMPLVVLINEGSASASEIVSGALRYYADQGMIDCVVVGERSFGKGSVQNVWPLPPTAQMKLTTQYYFVPSGRIIHRRPHATTWGVDPHLRVEMLPRQISDSLLLRQDADLPADAKAPNRKPPKEEDVAAEVMYPKPGDTFPPNPNRLLTEGFDLQLQAALVVLQAKTASKTALANVAPAPAAKNPG